MPVADATGERAREGERRSAMPTPRSGDSKPSAGRRSEEGFEKSETQTDR